MSGWQTILIFAGLIGLAVWLARTSGKSAAISEVNKDNAKVADEQLKAASDRPDARGVADKLRDGKF